MQERSQVGTPNIASVNGTRHQGYTGVFEGGQCLGIVESRDQVKMQRLYTGV